MHPRRLMLQAFGPYAHKQVIDFRVLKESTFLLIHGPTGSGKTSILDGITFALYGDTSTGERQARHMRSDHAASSLQTEVEFDFCLGKDHYRINRSPEQPRPYKRGGGTTIQSPAATLWSRSSNAKDNDEGEVLASGYSEVTSKVEELLGFKSDQFRQVVVLPQGQFREFLLTGSQKREEILEILFKTGTYRFIQESLKEEARIIRNKWETVLSQKNMMLIDSKAKSLEELEEQFMSIKSRITTLEKDILEARRESAVAVENVKNGEQVLEKIKEKEEAENLLKDLESRKHIFHEKAGLLDKARKALPLKEVEKAHAQREKESLAAQKRYSELSSALEKARKEEESAQKRMKELEMEQPRIEELVKEIAGIEQVREKFLSLKTAIAELEEAEKEVRKTEDEDKRLKKNLGECEIEKEHKLELLKGKQEQANQVTILEQSCEQASEGYTIRLELDKCKNDYILAADAVEKARSEFEEMDRDLKQGKIELELLEKQRQQGQAAILASRLREGEACPVCGSTSHPSPAISDVQLPSEKEVADKKREILDREQLRQNLYDGLNEKGQVFNELKTKQTMFIKQLKDAATVNVDVLKNILDQKRKTLEEAKIAASEIEKIEKDLLTIRDREKSLKNLLEKNGEDIKKAAQNKGSAENRVKDLKTSIPEELQSEVALSTSLHALVEEKKYLEQTIAEVKKTRDEASRTLAQYGGALKQAAETLESVEQSTKASGEQFGKLLKQAGFLSPAQYREASALEDEIENLDAQIRDYESRKKAAKERYIRAQKLTKDMILPDIEKLVTVSEKATDILENKIREEQNLDNELKKISKLITEISKIEKELKKLDSRFQILGYISDLANGKNRRGMTFQRFVQATLLDDVLIAASHRLSIMSKGRFLLRRVMEREDKRTSGGLNLEIDDAYTGKSRSVSTLSGGESFLAALSLALGLADVVQSYAGGMRLDTLFIDEGFGSLDSESLDYALRALVDLRKGGRLVAIISHVTELRERIDTRLEIIPGKTGSTTRFITM